jgi:ABC-type nitrate/sulfonate/bicarbonate transport system permease component
MKVSNAPLTAEGPLQRRPLSIPGFGPRRIATMTELSRRSRFVYGVSGVVLVLGFWELAARLHWVKDYEASSPSGIVRAGFHLAESGLLWPAIVSTAKVFGIGFGISLLTGLTIGIVLGWYKRVEAVFDPWVSILYSTPRFALLPLIVVWAGVGLQAQVVVVWLISVFPIIINTQAGVGSIDRAHLRVARSFLATNRDVLIAVALPGAVPAIVAGIRQGLIQGLTGVVVAEYFFGNTGVGGLIFTSGLQLNTGAALCGAAIFALAALTLVAALRALERRLDRWRG